MEIMSALVIRNLAGGLVDVELEDGTRTTALTTTWLPIGRVVWVRRELGQVWRVAGR